MSELARKRKKTAIISGAVAAAAYVLILVIVFASGFDNLGYGSINDNVVTTLMLVCIVGLMMALVAWCRVRTPEGGLTSWKRVGVFALGVWGALILYVALVALGRVIPPLDYVTGLISVAPVLLLIPLVWFPIWTLIAAIRGAVSRGKIAEATADAAMVVAGPVPASPAPLEVATTEAVDADHVSPEAVPELDVDAGAVGAPDETATEPVAPGQPEPSKRRKRKLLIAGVAGGAALILIVMGVGLYVGDQYLRASQYDAVVTVMEQAEAAMAAYHLEENAAFEKRTKAGTTDAAQAEMVRSIKESSSSVAVDLGVLRSDLVDVPISGWHPEVEELRLDYLDYLDAWLTQYEGLAVATDGAEMAKVADKQSIPINTTWQLAYASAMDGMPSMFSAALPERIHAIFFPEDS